MATSKVDIYQDEVKLKENVWYAQGIKFRNDNPGSVLKITGTDTIIKAREKKVKKWIDNPDSPTGEELVSVPAKEAPEDDIEITSFRSVHSMSELLMLIGSGAQVYLVKYLERIPLTESEIMKMPLGEVRSLLKDNKLCRK